MAVWPIHLPAHTAYKHFSSQYVVFGWCDIVWVQVCLGHCVFLYISAVVLSAALWPYIFHVIAIKGTWMCPGDQSGIALHPQWGTYWQSECFFLMTFIVQYEQKKVLNIYMSTCIWVTYMAHSSYIESEGKRCVRLPKAAIVICTRMSADTEMEQKFWLITFSSYFRVIS